MTVIPPHAQCLLKTRSTFQNAKFDDLCALNSPAIFHALLESEQNLTFAQFKKIVEKTSDKGVLKACVLKLTKYKEENDIFLKNVFSTVAAKDSTSRFLILLNASKNTIPGTFKYAEVLTEKLKELQSSPKPLSVQQEKALRCMIAQIEKLLKSGDKNKFFLLAQLAAQVMQRVIEKESDQKIHQYIKEQQESQGELTKPQTAFGNFFACIECVTNPEDCVRQLSAAFTSKNAAMQPR